MILAFLVPVVLFLFVLFAKKKLLRGHWVILFSVGLVFALLLSFVSVWSVWNPNELSLSLPQYGNYSGVSAVSYPLWMNFYVTPARQRIVEDDEVVANVSFSVYVANEKVMETNGTLRYVAVFGSVPVEYELESPFHSDAAAFFDFLLLLFGLFNIVGFALGMLLCYILSRWKIGRQR
jgi:hypothetical protein